MTNPILFPSGKTDTQLKKDAKKLAKQRSIPLNQAQNLVARNNGLDMPWAKAIRTLSKKTKPIFSYETTVADTGSLLNITLSILKPIGIISGRSGCGKTVLSYILANHHLQQGKHVVISTCGSGIQFPSPPELDLSSHYLSKVKSKHDNLKIFDRNRPEMPLEEIKSLIANCPVGSLLVIDELYLTNQVSYSEFISFVSKLCIRNSVSCLLVGQDLSSFDRYNISNEDLYPVSFMCLCPSSIKRESLIRSSRLDSILSGSLNNIKGVSSNFIYKTPTGFPHLITFSNPLNDAFIK